jgi:dihydroorotate dehydrogenase (subfamily 1) family protein
MINDNDKNGNNENILAFSIADLKFSSPIFLASGTAGYGYELANIVDFKKIGAVITKGVSLNPREGNPTPRIAEFTIRGLAVGLLNSIGLQNPGVHEFTKSIMPKLKKLPTKIIANVFGEKEEEYKKVIEVFEESENPPDAYELNLSCPNTKRGGIEFGVNPKSVEKIVKQSRKSTKRPIIVKFSPFSEILPGLISIAKNEGADAFTLTNTIPSAIRDQKLGFFKGGLSGYPLKPIALRCVIDAFERFPEVKIVASGGVYSLEDVLDYITAGATAVQVGTGNFIDPQKSQKLAEELENELKKQGKTLQQIVGSGVKIEK